MDSLVESAKAAQITQPRKKQKEEPKESKSIYIDEDTLYLVQYPLAELSITIDGARPDCNGFPTLEILRVPENAVMIDIQRCDGLLEIVIPSKSKLRIFKCGKCDKLTNISGDAKSVTFLWLYDNESLNSIEDKWGNLKELKLQKCSALTTNMTSALKLEKLTVENCNKFSYAENNGTLWYVNLSNVQRKNFPNLLKKVDESKYNEVWSSLTRVKLNNIRSLEKLVIFANKDLVLEIENCPVKLEQVINTNPESQLSVQDISTIPI